MDAQEETSDKTEMKLKETEKGETQGSSPVTHMI
jgi:hypothetical protein